MLTNDGVRNCSCFQAGQTFHEVFGSEACLEYESNAVVLSWARDFLSVIFEVAETQFSLIEEVTVDYLDELICSRKRMRAFTHN